MALKNIIAPRQQVLNAQGNPVAGGQVFLYQPGTTTFITSYKDSGLVQAHTNPVRLSGSGRANIWISRDCDLRILDRNGNLILEELNANPEDLGVDQAGGLVPNGSFEIDEDADLVPDGWTLANETGSNNELDTAESTDGAQSFRFTSTGSGGGSLTTTDFFPVNDVDQLRVNFDMKASIATVLNIVRVEWYDASFVSISNSDIYSSTSNPLTFTSFNLLATPPALARFAKLRIIGGDPSVAIAGSSWWDRFNVFYPAVVSGVFDNITIQNNEIISTNTNGTIDLIPDGTGQVRMSHTAVEVARTLAAAAGGFQINNALTGAGFERVLTTSDRLIDVQVFIANGTWTKPAGASTVEVIIVGGGGGGAGCQTAVGQARCGGCGGGAGANWGVISAALLAATESVTVGAGGTAGAAGNNAGGNGGNSVFSSGGNVISAGGGTGGSASTGANLPGTGGFGATASAGVNWTVLFGVVGLRGQNGATQFIETGAANTLQFPGGSSGLPVGHGDGPIARIAATGNFLGINPRNYGAGAGGSMCMNNVTASAGRAGSDGIVIVRTYT